MEMGSNKKDILPFKIFSYEITKKLSSIQYKCRNVDYVFIKNKKTINSLAEFLFTFTS
jgi:hypothetical protein